MTDLSHAAVDVVIVSYRSAETIATAVASARSCPQVERIVIVDNCPGDGSAEAARAAGATTVVSSGANQGFASAVNLGLKESDAGTVLLLNPDASVDVAAVTLLVEALVGDDTAVIAGPVLVGSGGSLTLGARRFSSWWNRSASVAPVLHRVRRLNAEYSHQSSLLLSVTPVVVDYVWGAAMLVRRSWLDRVGGLDERFFMYSEDEDLGRLARSVGCHVILVPGARVDHTGGASSGGQEYLASARLAFATWQLLDKWDGRWRATLYRSAVRAAYVAWSVATRLRGDGPRNLRERATLALLRQFLRTGSAHPD